MIDLYRRYGEDYKTPCSRYAIDAMTDDASKYQASFFFRNLTIV